MAFICRLGLKDSTPPPVTVLLICGAIFLVCDKDPRKGVGILSAKASAEHNTTKYIALVYSLLKIPSILISSMCFMLTFTVS